jgi:hypothetical protein
MAAHALWMKKSESDRAAFVEEMESLDKLLDADLDRIDAESDALDAEEAMDEDGPTGAYDSDADAEERGALKAEREEA